LRTLGRASFLGLGLRVSIVVARAVPGDLLVPDYQHLLSQRRPTSSSQEVVDRSSCALQQSAVE